MEYSIVTMDKKVMVVLDELAIIVALGSVPLLLIAGILLHPMWLIPSVVLISWGMERATRET